MGTLKINDGKILKQLDPAPVADFSGPTGEFIGTPVTFTDTTPQGVGSREWTFEGGTPATGSSSPISVEYAATGSFDVSLSVTNSGGTDSITKTDYITISEFSWDPSQLNNLFDWWRTDEGLALSGSDVTSWTSKVNSNVLSSVNNNYATYAASYLDWNSEPSILFNPNSATSGHYGYLTDLGSPASNDRTTILVAKLIDTNLTNNPILVSYNNYPSDASFRIATLGANPTDQYNFYSNDINETKVGPAIFDNGNYSLTVTSYESSTGNYLFAASQTSDLLGGLVYTKTSTSGRVVQDKLLIADYTLNGYNTSPKMSVVEVISLFGIPSAQDYIDLQNYLNIRYGI